MRTVSVKVQNDYLERISKAKKPILAIAELVWNGLDADATRINVDFETNALGGITSIRVTDDGHGITSADAISAFENLGGSWKRWDTHSKTKQRMLHGKAGRGRFQAFALGSVVEWTTRFKENETLCQYQIRGCFDQIGTFTIEEAVEVPLGKSGTTVTICDIRNDFPSLMTEAALDDLAEQLALYLMKYTDVTVLYNGKEIDPLCVVENMEDFKLPAVSMDNGTVVESELTVIEWKSSVSRSLVLCDESGFPLQETIPGVQAPGFSFTAYLKSNYLRTLNDENVLTLEAMDSDVGRMLDNAKEKLRQHFRVRTAAQARNLVQEWVKEEIYPYSGSPKDIVEQTERQVFDVLALNVNSYLPDFEKADRRNKQLSFKLLRQAIEQNAEAVLRILKEVLELPQEKQNELAQLLQKTSLTAIINASKEVTDRLDFLRGLEMLVFEPQSKQVLLERKQLHRVLAEETWIFGEAYRLSVDDQSLTEVLEKHLSLLGQSNGKIAPVLIADGSHGIVDLMLSRVIPQPHPEEHEHLIVELKRPRQNVDDDVANQIRKYAFAVAEDERFRDTKTRWNFVALSNDISTSVRRQSNQRGKPQGLLHDDAELNISIWVKTWAQIIEEARARLHFFQKELAYRANNDSAIDYLKRTHDKYLPDHIKGNRTAL
jgi:hypothetical protein